MIVQQRWVDCSRAANSQEEVGMSNTCQRERPAEAIQSTRAKASSPISPMPLGPGRDVGWMMTPAQVNRLFVATLKPSCRHRSESRSDGLYESCPCQKLQCMPCGSILEIKRLVRLGSITCMICQRRPRQTESSSCILLIVSHARPRGVCSWSELFAPALRSLGGPWVLMP